MKLFTVKNGGMGLVHQPWVNDTFKNCDFHLVKIRIEKGVLGTF